MFRVTLADNDRFMWILNEFLVASVPGTQLRLGEVEQAFSRARDWRP